MIDPYIVNRVTEAANIVDIVGDFVKLRKIGSRYTGICPFHADNHDGNFIVYPEGNCYKCFACGHCGGAVNFLMEHTGMTFPDAIRYIAKKYDIYVDDQPPGYEPPPPRPPEPPKPTLVLPYKIVRDHVGHTENDNLCNWLRSQHWNDEQRKMVDVVLSNYLVGHSTISRQQRDGSTITHEFTTFWQVDVDGHPRTAHYMKYKPDGHRVKDKDQYPNDWFHSMLERHRYTNIYDPGKQKARLCLYGEHLLNAYPNAAACVVESEKTAIIMAIAYGNNDQQVWLACCGQTNISRDRMAPLISQRRQIVLYPDVDAVASWTARMAALKYPNAMLDTRAIRDYWKPCDGPKADIADIVLRIINENP